MIEGVPVRQDVTSCDGCGAKIIFVKTAAAAKEGRTQWMPLDAKPERRIWINKQQLGVSITVWVPHHLTCPKADDFRKKK
ncbi:hypothetical protein LCGC14_0400790 [marine sediment metagenome]|uniref:Uncharacterized protein n=1 Tax=marine sediment metagenome TaxID=412755 RepID=A0A0F9VIP7_9ZZZZ